jgi:hypothetical protein
MLMILQEATRWVEISVNWVLAREERRRRGK